MSSDIQQLTNRLLAALNSNYEVIDTSAVLLVISQLEQTTITKEQLEATRLGKYINLLRRRTWSESLARRAKNLLKKWRNMVITPATTQSTGLNLGGGGAGGLSQQSSSNQNQHQSQSESQSMTATKHQHHLQNHHVSLSQPTSPVIQSSGNNNQRSSRHYPGQLRNTENSSLPEYPCSGSTSSSIIKNVPSTSRKQNQNQQHSNLSNGGHQQQQQQQQQSQGSHKVQSGKSIFSKTTSKSPQTKRQPISFANLIESQLHPPGSGGIGGSSGGGGTNNNQGMPIRPSAGPSSFLIDDNRSQSPLALPRIPRIPRDRQSSSPMIIEHSVSPLDLDQNSNPSRGEDGSSLALPLAGSINATNPAANLTTNVINNNTISSCSRLLNGDYAATSIDLHDSNSNMIGSLRESMIDVQRFLENRSSEHRKSKKHKKDKRRHKQDRGLHEGGGVSVPSDDVVVVVTKSTGRTDQNQLLSDETQICGGGGASNNTYPIQETLSLSNSSLSRFPSTSTNITIPASSNRSITNHTGKIESDLTFAGKFKKTQSPNATSLLQIQKSPRNFVDGTIGETHNRGIIDERPPSNLVDNGQDAAAAAANYPTVINPAKKSKRNDGRSSVVVIESRSCSPFTPIRGNSNDSTSSSSHNSAHDLIEVVNHESQGNDFIPMRPIATALPMQQQQQQQQIPPQTILKPAMATMSVVQDVLIPKENKIPKRRGRKKGSKGADAMLAQFNNQLFEGSKLLSLASLSSCKKVKTTKELLADIQNRKLESTVSSPTLTFQSRPPSTSSEPSLHSASTSDACSTNATISTVARSTPDKNIVLIAPFRPSGVDEDSGSNMSGSGIVPKKDPPDGEGKSYHGTAKGEEPTTSIEDDIRKLMSSLPTVKREKIDWGMVDEIICTCTIKEIEPQMQPEGIMLEKDVGEVNDEGGIDGGVGGRGCNDEDEGDFKFQVIIKSAPNETRAISRQDGGISVKIKRSPSPGKMKVTQKPIKSIFDLDYDEENDPLKSFVEAAKTVKIDTDPGANESEHPGHHDERDEKVISVSLPAQMPKADVMSFPGEMQPLGTLSGPFDGGQQQSQQPPGVPQNSPQFEVIEDPDCPAKQRYEVQTNCITKFHVHTLHNRYVPGVNGSWDQSDCSKEEIELKSASETTPDGLYERVVPQYNFLIMDKIPKDLSHIQFARNYQRVKQLKQARRTKMKRKRCISVTNAVEEGEELKHLKKECPSHDLRGKLDDIVTVVKREMDDGFDSNMNLSNCSDKAAATCSSPVKPIDGEADDRLGVGVAIADSTERTIPSLSVSNQNSNNGSRRSSSCSNSSVNLSNTLSCSNNGGKPNINVSHNLSNNIEESGDNSVEDNCSEYRGDDGDDDDEGVYYDDDDDEEDEDEDEDHGKFQVQVVEPESTWSTSTVGNKLVLTLKKTPLSLSFKCTDKAGTSKNNNNKRDSGGIGIKGGIGEDVENEVKNSNGNEMAVAPDTVDSLSNNIASSGWIERELNETIATKTTTEETNETIMADVNTTKMSKISKLSTIENQSASELRDPKNVLINQNDFEAPQDIVEIDQEEFTCPDIDKDEVYNDYEVMTTVCSSPGLNRNCRNEDDEDKPVVELKFMDQSDEEYSSESISNHAKYENDYVYIKNENKDEDADEDEDYCDGSHNDDPGLPEGNNELLPSFNCLNDSNRTGFRTDSNTGKPQQFKEWHEVLQVRSYNDELLTILPYVVID